MKTTRLDDRLVVIAWIATRLVLVATAAFVMGRTGKTITQITGNWDVQHFMTIARDGYTTAENMAFFPGLPLLMRAFSLVGVPMEITGVALGMVGSLVAALALNRLGGAWAACAWLLAPMTVFTGVGYTESLFCAAGFWAWYNARRGRWGIAAILAALACSLRVSGLFLVGGLGLLALCGGEPTPTGVPASATEKHWNARLRHATVMALPLFVFVAYVGYLYTLTGSWEAWFQAQQAGWQRSWNTPWQAFQNTIFATRPESWPNQPSIAWMFRFEIVSVVIGYLTALVCLLYRAWAQAGYVLAQVIALSCSTWFISVNRADLLWFPLFIGIGAIASMKPKSAGAATARIVVLTLVIAADLALTAWWASLFYTGSWAS